MSSNTLSAVLEKKIRQLCLNDFPCGLGSWRKTTDDAGGAETEETDDLLDLLDCPCSPWQTDESWSPQTTALRRLAVVTPQRLHDDFIYSYFTSLRIVDKGVSVIDDKLLKFLKLEELVLSANEICEIPAGNLPSTLKVLELRANRLSTLHSLGGSSPPQLHHLGLGSNSLGHREDASYLTGSYWPQLVSLDLSDCEFQDQVLLLDALDTLPRLRALVLEGNPFTLACCYPGFTVDRLPQLSLLDAVRISPEERHNFRNLAQVTDLIVERALATVSLGTMRGIPNLATMDENMPDFPVVTYSYFITYDFLSHRYPAPPKCNSESICDVTEDDSSRSKHEARDSQVDAEDTCSDFSHVSSHSSSKMPWSKCMDFADAQKYVITDLGRLKRFLNQGLNVAIVEEKVLSWPKKKKSLPKLVQDDPIRTVLGSVHVPLHGLILRGQKINVLCDFGAPHKDSEVTATQTPIKKLGKKIKDDKKKDDRESKQGGGSGTKQKNTASSKGKGKEETDCKVDVHTDDHVTVHPETVTVEFSVELERWHCTSEAQQLPH